VPEPVRGHPVRALAAVLLALAVVLTGSAGPARVRATIRAGDAVVRLGVPGGPIEPAAHWERLYLSRWDRQDAARNEQLSRSADSWAQYELAYGVDELTALYRATGNPEYASRALRYAENVVATARVSHAMPSSQYRDAYRGWLSERADSRGREVPLPESYLWRYVTALLRVIRQSPLYAGQGFRGPYERLLTFAHTDVFDKWASRGAETNIYRSRTHMAAHWAQITANLAAIDPDPGQRARYRAVVTRIDTALRGQLRANPAAPAAYFWDDEWGGDERPGQDVAHGNGVLAYLADAHETGRFWTATDLGRMCLLLADVVIPDGGGSAAFVDGTGRGTGWLADGFVKLGRYDPAVQWRLARHRVVNGQYLANLALNAKLLSESGTDD
jgi:hypothetical protein